MVSLATYVYLAAALSSLSHRVLFSVCNGCCQPCGVDRIGPRGGDYNYRRCSAMATRGGTVDTRRIADKYRCCRIRRVARKEDSVFTCRRRARVVFGPSCSADFGCAGDFLWHYLILVSTFCFPKEFPGILGQLCQAICDGVVCIGILVCSLAVRCCWWSPNSRCVWLQASHSCSDTVQQNIWYRLEYWKNFVESLVGAWLGSRSRRPSPTCEAFRHANCKRW